MVSLFLCGCVGLLCVPRCCVCCLPFPLRPFPLYFRSQPPVLGVGSWVCVRAVPVVRPSFSARCLPSLPSPYLVGVAYPVLFSLAVWRYSLLSPPCGPLVAFRKRPRVGAVYPFPYPCQLGPALLPPPLRNFCPVPVLCGYVFPFSSAPLWTCGTKLRCRAWAVCSVRCDLRRLLLIARSDGVRIIPEYAAVAVPSHPASLPCGECARGQGVRNVWG